jgi:hypothetical protein
MFIGSFGLFVSGNDELLLSVDFVEEPAIICCFGVFLLLKVSCA